MSLKLENKRALVTGSTRGIGFGIAKVLLSQGAFVTLNSRDKNGFPVGLGDRASFVSADVTRPEDCKVLRQEVERLHRGLDILVCNVGSGRSVPSGTENYDEWMRVLHTNLLSATNTIETFQSSMMASRGSIVCISSIAGVERVGAPTTYSVAKAALNAYVKNTSVFFAKQGVRINAVAPGNILFEGSVWDKKRETEAEKVSELLQREVPLVRFGEPKEVGSLVAFLCSEEAGFITGSLFTIDGGQTRSL